MLRTIIVDDEVNSREVLQLMLEKYCPEVEIVGLADGAESGIRLIKAEKPDLVLLDIQMPDGSGFDILEALTPVDFQVVFITAYNEFATLAFEYSAIHYLVKPVNIDQLKAAIDRAHCLKPSDGQSKLEELLKNLKILSHPKRNTIPIPTGFGLKMIPFAEIIRLEADGSCTTIFLKGSQKIVATRNMAKMASLLDPSTFVRTHHSHMVNLNEVRDYYKGEGGYSIMTDGANVPVSRRRKDEFLMALGKPD